MYALIVILGFTAVSCEPSASMDMYGVLTPDSNDETGMFHASDRVNIDQENDNAEEQE